MTLPVVADLRGLLRRLAREEEAERQGLARLEARVRRYEDVEEPAYRAWLRLAHGPLVTRIDELAAELRARRMLAERVTELVEDEGLHPREALWVVQEAAPARGARRDGAPTADEIAARRRAKLERKRAERRQANRERKAAGGGPPTRVAATTGETARRRLLGLYRALARSLHPDSPSVVRTLTPARLRAVWSEVQAAYAVRSLERLLALETWLATVRAAGADAAAAEPGEGGLLSLAERHERLRALRRAARALERRLADLTHEPAWEFARASAGERRKLERGVVRRLTGERDAMGDALAAVDAFLDRIGPPRPPPVARRR